MKKLFATLLFVALGLVCQTHATTWSFDYSGAGVSASGTLTTGAFNASYNGYQITGITGFRNGVAIDGLVPNLNFPGSTNTAAGPAGWYITYDNLLTAGLGFDFSGLYYASGGVDYNVYLTGGTYYELTLAQVNAHGGGSLGTVLDHVSVPENASTIVMLGGVLLGLAALRRRFVS